MPVLKKLLPNIRLGKEKKAEPCPAPVVEKQSLKRANARLRRNHEKRERGLGIKDGLSIVHSGFPIRDGVQVSRQNSFESGQSKKDFDISPKSRPKGLYSHLGVKWRGSADALASWDKPLDVLNNPIRPRSPPLPPRSPDRDESTDDLDPMYLHPINLATAAGTSAQVRRSLRLSRSSVEIRPVLKVVNADPEPEPSPAEKLLARAHVLARSQKESKDPLPPINYLDWNRLTDEEVRNIAKAYDEATSLTIHNRSPADSAIAMSRSESLGGYSGKGKGRMLDDQTGSRPASAATDIWFDPPESEFIDDGISMGSGPASLRNTTIDLLDSPREQKLSVKALSDAMKLEQQELEHEQKLLADAWQIESSRYMEQARQREELLQDQAKEDWVRKEQEVLERLERLEEELLQQALREIEEEEMQERDRLIAEELARQKVCCVCGDSMDKDKFPDKPPASACEHPVNTCKECLESWMTSEIDTKGCDGIKCPECSETLEYHEVQVAASQETFETYDKLTIRNALGGLDEFAWCLKAGCGSGQLNIDNNHFMDCASCGYKQCLHHKVAWHNGETCEQYEYRTSGQKERDEKKEQEMLDKLSKRCPGTNCGWRIEKIDGCEHMTCKKCKHEFCWQCLASHVEIKRVGNTAHAPTCKFHSTNLDLAWPFNMH